MDASWQPMVVLRHTLPDATWHFDWLLAPAPPPALLITFRVIDFPGRAGKTTIEALRMPDHRRAYLEFEGEISNGRGFVERMASGRCRVLANRPDRFEARFHWDGEPEHLVRARPDTFAIEDAGDLWQLEIAPAPTPST